MVAAALPSTAGVPRRMEQSATADSLFFALFKGKKSPLLKF